MTGRQRGDKYHGDHYHAVWDALDNVLEAWEALPGNRDYAPREIEAWLSDYMKPAIDKARKAMGREVGDGTQSK